MQYSGLGGEAPGERAGTASQGAVSECGHNSAIRAGDDSVHSILGVAWDSSVGRVSPAGVEGGFGELRDDPHRPGTGGGRQSRDRVQKPQELHEVRSYSVGM